MPSSYQCQNITYLAKLSIQKRKILCRENVVIIDPRTSETDNKIITKYVVMQIVLTWRKIIENSFQYFISSRSGLYGLDFNQIS